MFYLGSAYFTESTYIFLKRLMLIWLILNNLENAYSQLLFFIGSAFFSESTSIFWKLLMLIWLSLNNLQNAYSQLLFFIGSAFFTESTSIFWKQLILIWLGSLNNLQNPTPGYLYWSLIKKFKLPSERLLPVVLYKVELSQIFIIKPIHFVIIKLLAYQPNVHLNVLDKHLVEKHILAFWNAYNHSL